MKNPDMQAAERSVMRRFLIVMIIAQWLLLALALGAIELAALAGRS